MEISQMEGRMLQPPTEGDELSDLEEVESGEWL